MPNKLQPPHIALRSTRIAEALLTVKSYEGEDDWRATIVDAVTDLYHLCDKHKLSSDKIFDLAKRHHADESAPQVRRDLRLTLDLGFVYDSGQPTLTECTEAIEQFVARSISNGSIVAGTELSIVDHQHKIVEVGEDPPEPEPDTTPEQDMDDLFNSLKKLVSCYPRSVSEHKGLRRVLFAGTRVCGTLRLSVRSNTGREADFIGRSLPPYKRYPKKLNGPSDVMAAAFVALRDLHGEIDLVRTKDDNGTAEALIHFRGAFYRIKVS